MNDTLELGIAINEAEEALIGSILIQSTGGTKDAINAVRQVVTHLDFRGCLPNDKPERWTPRGRIFYAMTLCELPPHDVNTALKLNELGLLQLRDCALLAHCVSRVPCSLDYLDYANAVKAYSLQRQVQYHAQKGNYQKLNRLTQPDLEDGIKL